MKVFRNPETNGDYVFEDHLRRNSGPDGPSPTTRGTCGLGLTANVAERTLNGDECAHPCPERNSVDETRPCDESSLSRA